MSVSDPGDGITEREPFISFINLFGKERDDTRYIKHKRLDFVNPTDTILPTYIYSPLSHEEFRCPLRVWKYYFNTSGV